MPVRHRDPLDDAEPRAVAVQLCAPLDVHLDEDGEPRERQRVDPRQVGELR